jgi:hypothetical protein
MSGWLLQLLACSQLKRWLKLRKLESGVTYIGVCGLICLQLQQASCNFVILKHVCKIHVSESILDGVVGRLMPHAAC